MVLIRSVDPVLMSVVGGEVCDSPDCSADGNTPRYMSAGHDLPDAVESSAVEDGLALVSDCCIGP